MYGKQHAVMRKKRVVQAGKRYHLLSRVEHRALFLADDEKDRFVDLLMRGEFFSCVRVLAYCRIAQIPSGKTKSPLERCRK